MKNTIKKTLAFIAVGLAASALVCQQAQATPITGQISFSGNVNVDQLNDLATATRIDHWYNTAGTNSPLTGKADVNAGATGDFSGIIGGTQADFFNGYTFSPSTPTPGLWSVGGFTFNLLTSTIISQSSTGLVISGTGTIVSSTNPALDATAGTWDFRITNAGGGQNSLFSFAASTSANVPDGGSAVALLGLGLAGIEALRRKFARK